MFNCYPQVCLVFGFLSWFTLPVYSKVSRYDMFPFGLSRGDSVLPKCLSCYEGPLKLKVPIRLLDQEYKELYVNTDGLISFNSGIDFYPKTCGDRSSRGPLIAPFWTDVDTRRGGHVYYRETTDQHILDRAVTEVLRFFPVSSVHDFVHDYVPMKSVVIVTWDNVSYARSDPCADTFERNTFQAVITTNVDGLSYAIFFYNDLTWTGGLFYASRWTCEWGLKDHASAGFSFGDEPDFRDILGHCPSASPTLNLMNKSNLNVAGKWIFRLDSYLTENISTDTDTPTTTTTPSTYKVRPTTDTTEIVFDNIVLMSRKLKEMMNRVMSFTILNFVI